MDSNKFMFYLSIIQLIGLIGAFLLLAVAYSKYYQFDRSMAGDSEISKKPMRERFSGPGYSLYVLGWILFFIGSLSGVIRALI